MALELPKEYVGPKLCPECGGSMTRSERDVGSVEAGINPWPFLSIEEKPRVISYQCVDCRRIEHGLTLKEAVPQTQVQNLRLRWAEENSDVVRAVQAAKAAETWGTEVTLETVIEEIAGGTGLDVVPLPEL